MDKKKRRLFVLAAIALFLTAIALSPKTLLFAIAPPGTTWFGASLRWEAVNSIVTPNKNFELYTGSYAGDFLYVTFKYDVTDDYVNGRIKSGWCLGQNWASCKEPMSIDYQHFADLGISGKNTLQVWVCNSGDLCGIPFTGRLSQCHERCDEIASGDFAAENWCLGNCGTRENQYLWGPDFSYPLPGTQTMAGQIDIWVDSFDCVLESGDTIVADVFDGPVTIGKRDMRFAVKSFCSSFPILVLEEGKLPIQLIEEYDLIENSSVDVPAGQQWHVYYLTSTTGIQKPYPGASTNLWAMVNSLWYQFVSWMPGFFTT